METELNKEERIEIRVSSKDKKIFQRAQKLSGDRTFSSFIVRVVRKEAEDIVAENQKIIASERDRQIFFDAVFSDKEPNENLISAARSYKALVSST